MYGVAAIAAITAQNTVGVTGVQEIEPHLVAAQIGAVLSDFPVRAAKTGMLSSAPIIEAVVDALDQAPDLPVVVDPVMVAKSGVRLLRPEAVTALKNHLLPRAALLTPNLPEAADLTGCPVDSEAEMRGAGAALLDLGPRAVLVKGGHLPGDRIVDLLFTDGEVHEFRRSRIHTRATHGAGCTLSAAIAARLAAGQPLATAAHGAGAYVGLAMTRALPLGAGHGPLAHLPPDPWGGRLPA